MAGSTLRAGIADWARRAQQGKAHPSTMQVETTTRVPPKSNSVSNCVPPSSGDCMKKSYLRGRGGAGGAARVVCRLGGRRGSRQQNEARPAVYLAERKTSGETPRGEALIL